jgi:hypothetical protein
VRIVARLAVCCALALPMACGKSSSPPGGAMDPDGSVDGGADDAGGSGGRGGRGAGAGGSRNAGRGGSDDPDPPATAAGPTSISPSGGTALGQSDSYRLQVVVGAPQPMSQGSSANFKLRIGARLAQ